MGDERLRRLERAAARGDLDGQARLLYERLRLGALCPERLAAAAFVGDPAARRALGEVEGGPPPSLREGWRRLRELSLDAWLRAGLAALVEVVERDDGPSPEVRALRQERLRALSRWLESDAAARRATRLAPATPNNSVRFERAFAQLLQSTGGAASRHGLRVRDDLTEAEARRIAAELADAGAIAAVTGAGRRYAVHLVDCGDSKIPTIRALRASRVPPLSLRDAKDLADAVEWRRSAFALAAGLLGDEAAVWRVVREALVPWALA